MSEHAHELPAEVQKELETIDPTNVEHLRYALYLVAKATGVLGGLDKRVYLWAVTDAFGERL